MSNNNINYGGGAPVGIGLCGLFTIVFIVLKLLGYINWSWVWVLAPLWISWIIGIVFILICVAIIYYCKKKK